MSSSSSSSSSPPPPAAAASSSPSHQHFSIVSSLEDGNPYRLGTARRWRLIMPDGFPETRALRLARGSLFGKLPEWRTILQIEVSAAAKSRLFVYYCLFIYHLLNRYIEDTNVYNIAQS